MKTREIWSIESVILDGVQHASPDVRCVAVEHSSKGIALFMVEFANGTKIECRHDGNYVSEMIKSKSLTLHKKTSTITK